MASESQEALRGQVEEHRQLRLLQQKEEIDEMHYRLKLLNIYQEAAIHKETVAQEWEGYTDFVRGKQWPRRRPKYKVSAVLNFLLENIERKVALLTDAKPLPNVVPRSDEFQDTADILNVLLSIIFEDSEYGQVTADNVENAQVFGSCFSGTIYDKDADVGHGAVRVVGYDPRAIFFDPLVRKAHMLNQGEFVIIEDVWSLAKAKDLFPKRADMLVPDAGLSKFRIEQNQGFFGRIKDHILRTRQQDEGLTSEVPRVYVREFWLRDRKKKEGDTYRFKNGIRKSILIGETLVDDGETPYDDGDYPADMMNWHTDYDTGWGWGDVELSRNPQEMLNKLVASTVENAMLMSNAIWVGDANALSKEDWQKLSNAPGLHVKKRPGSELRREVGNGVPPGVLEVAQFLSTSNEKLLGLVDVMRGIRTGQVSSGSGIESLQMMAQALIRLRARSLEAMQARQGRKLISRIFQFYEPNKIFEVLKTQVREGEVLRTLKSELLKPVSKRNPAAASDVIFQIEPGSSLGLAKTQKRTEAMRLREMQIIDDRALLDMLEYPHRNKIIERVEQKRQDAANAEIAAQESAAAGGKQKQFPNQGGASPAGRT